MQISLAQAVSLRSMLNRRMQELVNEREQVAVVSVPKGEKYEKPTRTVEQVTEELDEVRRHYRQLDLAMARANLTHTVQWDGQALPIMEAIELAKQLRAEMQELKRLALRNRQEYSSNWGEAIMVKYTMYDPDVYKERAKKLERKTNRLSHLIEAANHQAMLDFPPAVEYLGE